jgi:hypothetical protein
MLLRNLCQDRKRKLRVTHGALSLHLFAPAAAPSLPMLVFTNFTQFNLYLNSGVNHRLVQTQNRGPCFGVWKHDRWSAILQTVAAVIIVLCMCDTGDNCIVLTVLK